jgi:hypothetical protein
VLGPIGDRAARQGVLLEIALGATDVDGNRIRFTAAGAPTGATLVDAGNGTASFRWTPGAAQAGTFRVTFTATDDGVPLASDSEQIAITVGSANRPPTLAPIGSRGGDVGIPVAIALSATDLDANRLAFNVAGAPTGSTLTDRRDGTAEWSWLPGPGQSGNFPLTFTVTDDGTPIASDSESITLTIGPVNRPPVLQPIGDRSGDAGAPLEIALVATDPDGDALAFQVSGSPPDAVFTDHKDGTARWSWLAPAGASAPFKITFTVTDAGAPPARASEQVTVAINGGNQPPVLAQIGNRSGPVAVPMQIALTATDPDGDALEFAAQGLPAGARLVDHGDRTAQIDWTPGATQLGRFPIVVTVRESGGGALADSEAFAISTELAPSPPRSGPSILDARWSAGDRKLRVRGQGAARKATVSIVDDASDALLGVARADDRGRFALELTPFVGPCAVRARTGDASSRRVPVRGAPADCGRRLETRVKKADWSCEDAALELEVDRAPASGAIDVLDDASDLLLGTAHADHHGRVHWKAELASAPRALRLVLRLGDREWEIGPLQVRSHPAVCAPGRVQDEDDDEDEEHEEDRQSDRDEGESEGDR